MAVIAGKPKSRRKTSQILRRVVQGAFVVLILIAAWRHAAGGETAGLASLDALCPFGGLETLWRMLVEGNYVPKTHPSNLVLGVGLLAGVLLAGAAFCGWICPMGSLQDALTWIRGKLRIRPVQVPAGLDRLLRYGRFVILGLILYQTISTVKLWFAGYDPYRTIFSLGWLFEFNWAEQWPAYTVAAAVLVGSFLVPRAWCKYACPLGGVQSLLGNLSLLRIRRNDASCKACALCETPCPVGIAVARGGELISPDCIGCLACVEACPRHGALEVQLRPSWFDALRRRVSRARPAAQEA